MSFADENREFGDDYLCEESPVGKVYIPMHGVDIGENPGIRYEKYPWIEKFELDDLKPSMQCCIWQPPVQDEE